MTSTATLRDVLLAHEATQPNATLLRSPETDRVLTYWQFAKEARQLAARLHTLGINAGDHVGFLLHNGYQTTTIFLGTMAAGYVVTPLNLLSQGAALAYVLEHSDVRVVFTSAHYEQQLRDAISLLAPPRAHSIQIVVIDSDASEADRKSTRLNSSHHRLSRMPSSA